MWWARCVTQRYVKRNGGVSTRGIGRISLVGSFGRAFQRNSIALPASKARKIIYAGISTLCHTTILISIPRQQDSSHKTSNDRVFCFAELSCLQSPRGPLL